MIPMRLFTLSSYSDLIPGMIIAQNLHHPAVFIREGLIDERICSGDLVVRFLDTLEEANTLYSSSINDIVCLGALSAGQSVLLQIEAWDALASQLTPTLADARALSSKLLGKALPQGNSRWPAPQQPRSPSKKSADSQAFANFQQNLIQMHTAGFGLPAQLLNNCSTTAQPSQTLP